MAKGRVAHLLPRSPPPQLSVAEEAVSCSAGRAGDDNAAGAGPRP